MAAGPTEFIAESTNMKLMRHGAKGTERPALVDAHGKVRDLSGVLRDITASTLEPAALARLQDIDVATLPVIESPGRIAPPWSGMGKFICVGLNYADHAAESGVPVPVEPVLFMKATSALIGCNDPVVLPQGSVKGDWEVELGVVIGRKARYVSENDALAHVAGYCVVNDLSEREYQLERGGGQWDKGKGCDTFGPVGPWMVTRDEVPDPQDLSLWLEVNGHRFQDGNTRTMVFGVTRLVSYISRFMTLYPGDLISTGTPPGVGLGMKPPLYLKPGDEMRLGISGLGEQRQKVHAWNPALIDE
jgi:2,4-diketo-3-deoxy-L-fuconate hydrolase